MFLMLLSVCATGSFNARTQRTDDASGIELPSLRFLVPVALRFGSVHYLPSSLRPCILVSLECTIELFNAWTQRPEDAVESNHPPCGSAARRRCISIPLLASPRRYDLVFLWPLCARSSSSTQGRNGPKTQVESNHRSCVSVALRSHTIETPCRRVTAPSRPCAFAALRFHLTTSPIATGAQRRQRKKPLVTEGLLSAERLGFSRRDPCGRTQGTHIYSYPFIEFLWI